MAAKKFKSWYAAVLILTSFPVIAVVVYFVVEELNVWNLSAVVVIVLLGDLIVVWDMGRYRHVDAKVGFEAMIGKRATVEEGVIGASGTWQGTIKFHGERWKGVCTDGNELNKDEKVKIIGMNGLIAYVARDDNE